MLQLAANGASGAHSPSSGLVAPSLLGPKVRHVRGKYTVKEEVIKRVEISHPCRLTRTAVKVTFPRMKDEVLVSFIGYKEPNLMFVNRCKGLCSSEAIGRVACVPTKRRWKKVKMQLKTQVLGRDVKENFKELVLEEHESCACSCLTVTAAHCMRPELFSNETCSCRCDTSLFRRDQMQCEAYPGRVWDERTCACRKEDEDFEMVAGSSSSSSNPSDASNVPGGLDLFSPINGIVSDDGSVGGGMYDPAVPNHGCTECLSCLNLAGVVEGPDFLARHRWQLISALLILTLVLVATVFFFWRKSRRLEEELNLLLLDSSSSSSQQQQQQQPQQHQQQQQLQQQQHGETSEKSGHHLEHQQHRQQVALPSLDQKSLIKASSMTELDHDGLLVDKQHSMSMERHQRMLTMTTTAMSNSLGKEKRRLPTTPLLTPPPPVPPPPPPLHLPESPSNVGAPDGTLSSTKRSHHRSKGHHHHRRKNKPEKAIEAANVLDEAELIQQCYFEDDLDPNFINHKKIGAEFMNI